MIALTFLISIIHSQLAKWQEEACMTEEEKQVLAAAREI